MSDRIDVEYGHRVTLYHPDGRALVRKAGFAPEPKMALQSTGQFPQLNVKPKSTKKPTKKGGGKRGC